MKKKWRVQHLIHHKPTKTVNIREQGALINNEVNRARIPTPGGKRGAKSISMPRQKKNEATISMGGRIREVKSSGA